MLSQQPAHRPEDPLNWKLVKAVSRRTPLRHPQRVPPVKARATGQITSPYYICFSRCVGAIRPPCLVVGGPKDADGGYAYQRRQVHGKGIVPYEDRRAGETARQLVVRLRERRLHPLGITQLLANPPLQRTFLAAGNQENAGAIVAMKGIRQLAVALGGPASGQAIAAASRVQRHQRSELWACSTR